MYTVQMSERLAVQTYENDVSAWALEQALFLRTRRFELLDIEHIADELEDVGKREQRELARGLARLLTQLLKWQYRPTQRDTRLTWSILALRREISYTLGESPSLAPKLQELSLLGVVWAQAVAQFALETGLDCFPGECPWVIDSEVLAEKWLPL